MPLDSHRPEHLPQGDYVPHVLVEAVLRAYEYLAGLAVVVTGIFTDAFHVRLLVKGI